MKNLIICPVGNKLSFDDRFDKDRHWRYSFDDRLYDTLVFAYSDFIPECGTYDMLIHKSGFKWSLSKEWLQNNDYLKYDYIGFMDDDLITDIDNINKSLLLAKENNFSAFQLSLTNDSDVFYPILKNVPTVKYTKTNFIELMGMFIHTSKLDRCIDLWNQYDIYSGWGFDKILCDLIEDDLVVIHSAKMYHPKRSGNYNKSNAFKEMDELVYKIFPNYMKTKYGKDWKFNDSQVEKKIFLEI